MVARRPVPRGPLLSPERRADRRCRRCGHGLETSPPWPATSSGTSAASSASASISRAAALDALIRYDWPGNVRELRNAVERAVVLADGGALLEPDDFSFDMAAAPSVPPRAADAAGGSVFEEIAHAEAERIKDALRKGGGSKAGRPDPRHPAHDVERQAAEARHHMTARWRRAALALVLVATWASPYVLSIGEGQDGAGWYVVFALSAGLTLLLIWSVLEDLTRLAATRSGTAAGFRGCWRSLRGSRCSSSIGRGGLPLAAFLSDWGPPVLRSAVDSVHHAILLQIGVGVALPALVVLTSGRLRTIDERLARSPAPLGHRGGPVPGGDPTHALLREVRSVRRVRRRVLGCMDA